MIDWQELWQKQLKEDREEDEMDHLTREERILEQRLHHSWTSDKSLRTLYKYIKHQFIDYQETYNWKSLDNIQQAQLFFEDERLEIYKLIRDDGFSAKIPKFIGIYQTILNYFLQESCELTDNDLQNFTFNVQDVYQKIISYWESKSVFLNFRNILNFQKNIDEIRANLSIRYVICKIECIFVDKGRMVLAKWKKNLKTQIKLFETDKDKRKLKLYDECKDLENEKTQRYEIYRNFFQEQIKQQ